MEITTHTIFETVSVKDSMPKVTGEYFVFKDIAGLKSQKFLEWFHKDRNEFESALVTHWLKEIVKNENSI